MLSFSGKLDPRLNLKVPGRDENVLAKDERA